MRKAAIVTDIGYGDAGKGTTVDYLVRQAESAVVIRHNGGPQAAHNVITAGGRHHTFAQFGSGSFVPGVRTHLSRYMLINPLNMFLEATHLRELGVEDIWQRTSVDSDAVLITPWHCVANRLREMQRGASRHGSCGQGVGETMADSFDYPSYTIRVCDINSPVLRDKLLAIRAHKRKQLEVVLGAYLGEARQQDEWQAFTDPQLIDTLVEVYRDWRRRVRVVGGGYLAELASQHELLVFEGAQGVLLDEWYGFHPYTTWSTTTHANALQLLSESHFDGEVTRYGVMRAYGTRHGAGPFVTEDASLAVALKEYHNAFDDWQGAFRYGHLDLIAHRYALDVCGGADALIVTGLDRIADCTSQQVCVGYRLDDPATDVDEFFALDAQGIITAIKPGIQGDLERAGRLTQLVSSCSPVYQPVSAPSDMPGQEPSGLLRTAEEFLGTPITIASYGPTAADKRALIAS